MLQTLNPANADILVNINGQLIHRDKAGVSPFDSAVQGGDAVWEGLRLYDGRIFKLTQHLDRLRSSALALAFAQIPPHEDIRREIKRTLDANSMRDNVHIRLTLTRGVKYTSGMDPRLNTKGPTLIVLAEHKAPVYDSAMSGQGEQSAAGAHGSGLSLVTSSVRRFPPDCLDPKIHHCNLIQSILAKIEANNVGADDAIMLDTRGFLAETNATHVFIVTGCVVATSRLVACPEGITRETVLELCARENIPTEVRDTSMTEVYRADEVFCTGTMGELAWVSRVDGRAIGRMKSDTPAAPGPMWSRLSTLYREHARKQGEQVV